MTSRLVAGRPAGSLPLTQFVDRPGAIDLAWGHPDPRLLPVDELRAAADAGWRRVKESLGTKEPLGTIGTMLARDVEDLEDLKDDLNRALEAA